MFILYAIPIGMAAGFLMRGQFDRLADLRLRWAPLALLGLVVQLALFSDAVGGTMGDTAPTIYVASTAAVLIAVLRNVAVPGMTLIALGAASNLVAIVANGGYMPADAAALAAIGGIEPGYSNSVIAADPALRPLTDIYALPAAFPFANVFSVGDILIGIGVAATIVIAMRVRPANGAGAAK